MRQAFWILACFFILAFSTSTGSYYSASPPDSTFIADTTKTDTIALLSQIQSVADSFAHEAVKKIDSVIEVPILHVEKIDIEKRPNGRVFAWLKIYKTQYGTSKYDTTIVVEIPDR